MNDKELQKLYNAVSAKFNVGTFDDFSSKMQTVDDRRSFFNVVNDKGFDVGDYNTYESRLSGKKKEPSEAAASTAQSAGFVGFSEEGLKAPSPVKAEFRTAKNSGILSENKDNAVDVFAKSLVNALNQTASGTLDLLSKGGPQGILLNAITDKDIVNILPEEREKAIQFFKDKSYEMPDDIKDETVLSQPLNPKVWGKDLGMLAGYLIPGVLTGGAGTGAGVGARAATMMSAAASAPVNYWEVKEEFRNAGVEDRDATTYAMLASVPMGLLDAIGLKEITNSFGISKKAGKYFAKEVIDDLAGKKITKEATKSALRSAAEKTGKVIKDNAWEVFKDASTEGVTEAGQEIIKDLSKFMYNESTGQDVFDIDASLSKYLQVGALGGILGGAAGLPFNMLSSPQVRQSTKIVEDIKDDPANYEQLIEDINNKVASGEMTEQQSTEAIANINKLIEYDNTVPQSITGEDRTTAVNNLFLIDKLEEEASSLEASLKQTDPSFGDTDKINIDRLRAKAELLRDHNKELATGNKFIYYQKGDNYFKKLGPDGKEIETTRTEFKEEILRKEALGKSPTPSYTYDFTEDGPVRNNPDGTVTAVTEAEYDANRPLHVEPTDSVNIPQEADAVIQKAEDDLSVLKQVQAKEKKYASSIRRLSEARKSGTITSDQFDDYVSRFNDVMSDSNIDIPEEAQIAINEAQEIEPETQQVQDDTQDQEGIPSGIEEGQAIVQEEPVQEGREEEVTTGGVLQAQREQAQVVEPGEEQDITTTETETEQSVEEGIPTRREMEEEISKQRRGGKEMRGLAERTKDTSLGRKMRSFMKGDTQSYFYTPQNIKELKAKIKAKSNEQLVEIFTDNELMKAVEKAKYYIPEQNNFAIIAGAELMNRHLIDGDIEAAEAVFNQLNKVGTTLGQLIRQFAVIRGSTPMNSIFVIEKAMRERGKELSADQRDKLLELYGDVYKFEKAYLDIKREQIETRSYDSYLEARKASDDLMRAEEKVNLYLSDIMPRSMFDLLSTIMQGNLLTPGSQITNLFGNLMYQMAETPVRYVAYPLEKIAAKIFGKEPTIVPAGVFEKGDKLPVKFSPNGFLAGGFKGLKLGAHEIVVGPQGEYRKLDVSRGLHPYRALQRLKDDMISDIKRRPLPNGRSYADVANDLVEGFLGGNAELNFRLLNAMDRVFKGGASNVRLREIAIKKGLKGKQIEMFQMFPDEASMDEAIEFSLQSTFQGDTPLSKIATSFFNIIDREISKNKAISGPAKLIIKSTFPFVRTPANVAWHMFEFTVPIIPFYKSIINYKNGDIRNGSLNFAKSIIGGMMLYAGGILAQLGIVTGPPEEERRKRNAQYSTRKPNTLNKDALIRWVKSGFDPNAAKFQNGDEQIEFIRFGVFGVSLAISSQVERERRVSTKPGKEFDIFDFLMGMGDESLNYLVEQSFLKGTKTIFEAIAEDKWSNWFNNSLVALSSVAVPNTLSAVSRAEFEFIPYKYDDEFHKTLSNTLKERLFMAEDLPVYRNIWGEKVERVPEGTPGGAAWYVLASPWRSHYVDLDPVTKELLDTYYITNEEADVWPPTVSRNITLPKVGGVKLDIKDWMILQEEIGRNRYKNVKILIKRPIYTNASPAKKIELLDDAYDKGRSEGVKKFVKRINLNKYAKK